MKVIALSLICFLSFGFVANNWSYLKNQTYHRDYYKKARPRPDKFLTIRHLSIDLKSFKIDFFGNLELEGKPIIVWDRHGIKFDGKTICGWEINSDGKYIVDPKCPGDLPFGSAERRKLGGEDLNTLDENVVKENNDCCSVLTMIEVEHFQDKWGNKEFNGDVGVISYRGKEYFFNHKKLKKEKWDGSAADLSFFKDKSLEYLNDKNFKDFVTRVYKCIEKRDAECITPFSSKFVNSIKGKKNIESFWGDIFKKNDKNYRELKYVFQNMRFPCVSIEERDQYDRVVLIGEESYVELLDHKYVQGKKNTPEWKISEFVMNKVHPVIMKYCDVKIHPTPVPTPTRKKGKTLFKTGGEYLKAVRTYQEESKNKKIPFGPWIKAYRKEIAETGEYKTKK